MKWKEADYQILVWATEGIASFFGKSGQSYTAQKGDGYTSFSFTLPNQTVIRLEPYVVAKNVVFYIFIDEGFFTNISETKQIADSKLRGLVEGAIRDFAAKAAVNRDLLGIAQQIDDRGRAQKRAELLKKLE